MRRNWRCIVLTSSFLLDRGAGNDIRFTVVIPPKPVTLESVGASKLGSVLVYVLVATIGMHMDVTASDGLSGHVPGRSGLDQHSTVAY